MSENNSEIPNIDPFAQMFQFYDAFSKSWSNVMSDTVASKSFAESMGQQMEGNLEAMKLMRQQIGGWMEQYLQQMNLPTRTEVISLSERLTKLEMVMDDIDAKLDEVLDAVKEQNS